MRRIIVVGVVVIAVAGIGVGVSVAVGGGQTAQFRAMKVRAVSAHIAMQKQRLFASLAKRGPRGPRGAQGAPGLLTSSKLHWFTQSAHIGAYDAQTVEASCPSGQFVLTGGFIGFGAASAANQSHNSWTAILYNLSDTPYDGLVQVGCIG